MSNRRVARLALSIGLVLAAIIMVAPLVSRDVRFVLRAGYEEARILSRRRALDELVTDPGTPPERRAQFELVLAARTFAAQSLTLAVDGTFSSFADVGRDTLVLVMSASPRTNLAHHLWWFPIVGHVPYKGFFSLPAAERARARLEARGYDTYLRPAAAFSTLGWFEDPLLSTSLRDDPIVLVSTVLHEVSHNTLYVPSATAFDESFATFVGYRGAEAFFTSRGDSVRGRRAAAIWRDELRLASFYDDLAAELDSLYRAPLPEERLLSERSRAFARARTRLVDSLGGSLEAYAPERLAARPLNNASIIAARLYRTRLALFDTILDLVQGDLARAIDEMARAAESGNERAPFVALEELVNRLRRAP